MRIGGLIKFSLIDYPGKMAAVIFTQGCNFHCPFCHNPELVKPESFMEPIPEEEVLAFLEKRHGQIEGLAITGGEPTIQEDLIDFLKKVKDIGYLIKLDSNGSNPDVLKEIFKQKLIDYVAMDIKAPLSKYKSLTNLSDCEQRIKKSIDLIISSNITHEFRTTLAEPVVSASDLPQITSLIEGAKKYRLQKFILRDKILDKDMFGESSEVISDEELAGLKKKWEIGKA